MTTVVLKRNTANHYITMSLELRTYGAVYVVAVCPMIGEHLCGHPIREMVYSINEEEKAVATFNRYCRKYD